MPTPAITELKRPFSPLPATPYYRASPADFVADLTARPLNEQTAYLAGRLPLFNPTEQDELASLLKQQADRYMRTDLQRCLHTAELLKQMAGQLDNRLYYALGLRAEGNAHAIGSGEFQRGIACYDEAAAIYGRSGRLLEQAWSQNGKIFALANLGEYDEALAVGKWASQVFTHLGEKLPLAELTVNLAIIHGRLSQDSAALKLLDQAHDLYEDLGPEQAARLLVVDMNRAIILRNLGRFNESIALNQAILEAYNGQGNAVSAARAQQNLAMTYFILGRYNEALALLDLAREAFWQDGRYRHAMLVELFTSDCLLQLRRFREAQEKCQRARQLFNQLKTPYEIGQCLLHEAHACIGLEQPEEALNLLRQARALFAQEGNPAALADADLRIAEVLLPRGEAAAAFDLALAATAVFQTHHLPLGQTRAHLLAARAALALTQLEPAADHLAQAMEIATAHNLPSLTYQAHHLQGTLAAQQGDSNGSIVAWRAGIAALEQLYGHLMLEYRADFAQDKIRLYEDLVALYVAEGRAADGLEVAERAKSRALQDLLAYRLDLRIEARSPADQPLVKEISALRKERDRLYRRWHTSEEPGQRDDPTAQLAAQQATSQRVLAIEQQITAVWHKLLVRNAAYAQDAALWQIQTEPIQPHLDGETALLEFFSVHDRLLLFVVTREGVQAILLEVTLAQVQQLLQLFWLNLRSVPQSRPERQAALTRNVQGVLGKLHQALFAPARAQLEPYRRLIVVPHGPLHYLPFHALFDGAAYLLEQFAVSYLPAASMLAYCRTTPLAEGGVLALGYSGNGRLPQAPHEAEALARHWPGDALLEEKATLRRLHRQAGDYRILHLATHGEFRPDNPLFSGLALADGWLTTLDIFNLRLRASLVTLSACQTGRSVIGGGDELLGLMRAFLAAGAASLVSTFWPVEDGATTVLMHHFYHALADGVRKGDALRQAQLAQIERHPYFWAPFFLVGDTGPL
jgi:CHAT domain-containing protein